MQIDLTGAECDVVFARQGQTVEMRMAFEKDGKVFAAQPPFDFKVVETAMPVKNGPLVVVPIETARNIYVNLGKALGIAPGAVK